MAACGGVIDAPLESGPMPGASALKDGARVARVHIGMTEFARRPGRQHVERPDALASA